MATYSITIRNSLHVYGASEINKWGTLVWQSATVATIYNYWGYTDDLKLKVTKGIAESFALDSDVDKNITKVISESLFLDSDIDKNITKLISNQLAVTGAVSSVEILNGDWKYLYPNNTTNHIDRTRPNWSAPSGPSATSWEPVTQPSTTWSSV
jgi:hypothetical protein